MLVDQASYPQSVIGYNEACTKKLSGYLSLSCRNTPKKNSFRNDSVGLGIFSFLVDYSSEVKDSGHAI